MAFAAPDYIWFLPLLLLIGLLTIRASLKRRQSRDVFVEPHLAPLITRVPGRSRRIVGSTCGILALCFIIFSLMRPQWGIIPEEQITTGLDVVIALDISRSMLADDLQPNRLAVAKSAIEKLLGSDSGNRIGIIAFSGTAYTVCPLTTDYALVRQIVNELGPDSLPRGGSSLSAALQEALRAFRGTKAGGRVLMVVTDGEDHDGAISPALQQLKGAGVAVMAVLAGTEEGGLITLPGGGFVKERNGAVVKSHASRTVIRAVDPSAVSLHADGTGLEQLLQRACATGITSERKEQRQRLMERFQLPLAVALLLLVVATIGGRGVKG
jgi:Ca-activated chloride channel family protein